MKILLLADVNSSHTQKWAISLKKYGLFIGIYSLTSPRDNKVWENTGVELFYLDGSKSFLKQNTSFSKLFYLKAIPYLKKTIKLFSPDIVHAHYITSYGLLSVLSGFHPLVMSAWGSDVLEFPTKSIIHKKVLEYILNKANRICVTSYVLQDNINRYTSKKIEIIPFGIDCEVFKPIKNEKGDSFVVGTAKGLEDIYGIDIVIKAFSLLNIKYPDFKMDLLIIGNGSQRVFLEDLSKKLNIRHLTKFLGQINVSEMPTLLNNLSVLANVSHNESFGVSVLEASACEICVLASNVGGLPEVVCNNQTGILVKPNNVNDVFLALEYLLLNQNNRKEMGINGRKKVINEYDLKKCVDKYVDVYNSIISNDN